MNIKRIIKHCNEQIEQWTATKRSMLFLLNGGAGSAAPNGHTGRMMRQAEAALRLHDIGDDDDDDDDQPRSLGVRGAGSRTAAQKKRDYRAERLHAKRPGSGAQKGQYGKARALPEIEIPKDLPNLAEMNAIEAVRAALQAARRPLTSMELTAVVVGGGFKLPASARRVPITRYVGQIAGSMAFRKDGIKKTPKGFELR